MCLFAEKQEVSGGRDRGVSVCMWREWGVVVERMGCGCGENGVWLWRAEVCGASDGCVLGSRGGEMGR